VVVVITGEAIKADVEVAVSLQCIQQVGSLLCVRLRQTAAKLYLVQFVAMQLQPTAAGCGACDH